jgi:transcriptional regulator with XRE-family HTH domain
MEAKELVIKKLKAIINKKYKTVKDFSDDFGINSSQMGKYLRGENYIGIEILEKIANHLNIHISYFFTDESSTADILDTELFDKIFNYAYDFAEKHNLKIKGTYFLGCYQLISETMQRERVTMEEAFEINKRTILRFVSSG